MLDPASDRPEKGMVLPTSIPALDFGGAGLPLHFLHANGYPPGCYRPLIERLVEQYHVFGMLLRPLWPASDPKSVRDWKPFSEDVRQFLHEASMGPVIGLGHSIGAVLTLRAALREPSLFRALILIDPVLLPPCQILRLRIARALGLPPGGGRLEQAALRRRRHFDSLEQLFDGYRRRDVFRFLSDHSLRALIEGITRPSVDGGYDLAYSPEWEARIYKTGIWNDSDLWSNIGDLRVPTLFLRGAETDTFFARTAELVRQRNLSIQTKTIPDATHLLPMEKPDEVAGTIRQFLASINCS